MVVNFVREDIDYDTFNIFLLEVMARAHGYQNFQNMWRNIGAYEDVSVRDMITLVKYNGGDLDIYFEHPDFEPLVEVLPHGKSS